VYCKQVYFYICLCSTRNNYCSTTLCPFKCIFSRTTWASRNQKGKKNSLDLNEARNDGVLGYSGISWTICKQSAPRSRQTTTPTPHHSIFTGRMLTRSRRQAGRRMLPPGHGCTHIRTHAHTDGQPENIMPSASSIGWVKTQ